MNQSVTNRSMRVICADLPAPPLFWRDEEGQRHGYEADVARLLGKKLGMDTVFVYRQWDDFYPALEKAQGDILLCGQGISEYRKSLADFTAPYAVFDESVMVLRDSSIKSATDLSGRRVGAIDKSLNMALAETFGGAVVVPFSGESDDVMGDMVAALRRGDIDAFVDDDVALLPLSEESDLAIAFTVETRNAWGIAVKKGESEWLKKVDAVLAEAKVNGELKTVWQNWMPALSYPFENAAQSADAYPKAAKKPKRALAVMHSPADVPGILPEILYELDIELQTQVVTEPLPDPETLEMVVVLGSPESAYDRRLPWLEPELNWLKGVVEADVPTLGICFGSQLLARALGGTAVPADEAEIGWTPVESRDPKWSHEGPWLNFHFDTFRLPEHVTLLAETKMAPQAFCYRSAWGVQFHPEITAEMFDTWLCDWKRSEEGQRFLENAGDLPERLREEISRHQPSNYANFKNLMRSFLDAVLAPDRENS